MFSLASRLRKAGCKTAILSNTEKPVVAILRMSFKPLTGVELKIFSKRVNGNLRRNGNSAAALTGAENPS